MERLLRLGFGRDWKLQSRSVPRFKGHIQASMTLRRVIAAARLNKQHPDVGVFSQTTRHHGSRGTRSADDEVVLRP